MTLDRALWLAEFSGDRMPWLCPACSGARLRVQPGTLAEGETSASRSQFNHPAWEPEWIDGRFTCVAFCPDCETRIAVAGKYRVKDERYLDQVHGESGDFVNYYRPLFFSEAPRIITLPKNTPAAVATNVEASFQQFWLDASACANRIRSAVEELLTSQRVPRTTGRVPGKRRKFLTLHARIEKFQGARPALADKLMAIKWLGNAGSHLSPISSDDLLDAYEILRYVLDHLYVDQERRVGALTREINRRRAPRSRRRPTE